MEPQKEGSLAESVENRQVGLGAVLGVTGGTAINAGLVDKLSMPPPTPLPQLSYGRTTLQRHWLPGAKGMTGKMCPLAPELWSPLSHMPGDWRGTFRSPSPLPCQLINWAVKGSGGWRCGVGTKLTALSIMGKIWRSLEETQ